MRWLWQLRPQMSAPRVGGTLSEHVPLLSSSIFQTLFRCLLGLAGASFLRNLTLLITVLSFPSIQQTPEHGALWTSGENTGLTPNLRQGSGFVIPTV